MDGAPSPALLTESAQTGSRSCQRGHWQQLCVCLPTKWLPGLQPHLTHLPSPHATQRGCPLRQQEGAQHGASQSVGASTAGHGMHAKRDIDEQGTVCTALGLALHALKAMQHAESGMQCSLHILVQVSGSAVHRDAPSPCCKQIQCCIHANI